MPYRHLLRILYPDVCPLCRTQRPTEDTGVCRECHRELRYVHDPVCRSCGGPLLTDHAVCRECDSDPRPWTHAATGFCFEGLARNGIHRFKYSGDVSIVPLLAAQAWRSWQRLYPDLQIDFLAPVPLHWMRRLTRGYNQAELACIEINRLANIPVVNALKRCRWTSPQASLSKARRKKNLSKAFLVCDPDEIRDKHILLVDDVMTTGATLAECSKLLLKQGAATVHVLTLARRM